jgi:hypothetical protein
MSDKPRVTPESDTATRMNRIGEMQQDLAFLFTVNWCDVGRVIQLRVLKHAVDELENADAEDP